MRLCKRQKSPINEIISQMTQIPQSHIEQGVIEDCEEPKTSSLSGALRLTADRPIEWLLRRPEPHYDEGNIEACWNRD